MIWFHAPWLAFGVALGVLHATSVWRSTKHTSAITAFIGMARLLTIGLALAAGAVGGGVLPAAAGWAVGFFASVGLVMATRSRISERSAAP
jgi:hypothetical protein